MISLYVVDDEKYIRESLCHSIDWASYGVNLIGSAQSGTEAYAFLSAHEVKIVITDIRMPDMDGLELIRKLRMDGNSAGFIILSGFNEFEYAQKAIPYGVSAYLLKPCAKEEIVNTVLSVSKPFQKDAAAGEAESVLNDNTGKIPNALRVAIAYMEENYAGEVTRESVADTIFVSPSYLSILFKKHCRVGFSEYLNKVRIERACKLLKDASVLKIYEVAQNVGFKDERYFSTVFKKCVGISPTDYRNSLREEK